MQKKGAGSLLALKNKDKSEGMRNIVNKILAYPMVGSGEVYWVVDVSALQSRQHKRTEPPTNTHHPRAQRRYSPTLGSLFLRIKLSPSQSCPDAVKLTSQLLKFFIPPCQRHGPNKQLSLEP